MEFEERARAVLPPHISAYYAAPAGSEADLDEGDTRLVGDPVPAAGASRHRIADPSRGQSSVRPYGHRFWSRRWPREPSSNRISGLLLHHLLDQRLRARSRPS